MLHVKELIDYLSKSNSKLCLIYNKKKIKDFIIVNDFSLYFVAIATIIYK
jgi:hypothetical protein